MFFNRQGRHSVSTSKSMVKCKINVDTDFTDFTDFHNHYQSL